MREKPDKKPPERSAPPRRASPPAKWLNVYWLSFGACLAVAFLLIGMAPRLAAYGLTGYVVYLVLVPLGLGAAAFLFGAMRSLAEYQGTLWFGTLRLGGPVVVFAMVVLGGLILPKPSRVQAVVHVYGPGGSDDVIRQGTVRLTLGQAILVQPIDPNGAAYFPDLSSELLGAPLEVSAQVEGYRTRPSPPASFPRTASSGWISTGSRRSSPPRPPPAPSSEPTGGRSRGRSSTWRTGSSSPPRMPWGTSVSKFPARSTSGFG